MNEKLQNIGIYYEDADGICVYDCETRVGISIDKYEDNFYNYYAEIIPVFFSEDFKDNDDIKINDSSLQSELTFTEDIFEELELEVASYYTGEESHDSYVLTSEGFACEIPKSFWECGMTTEEGSQRLEICKDILEIVLEKLLETRIGLCREKAEEVADDFNDNVIDDAQINSEDFADDVESALNKVNHEFITFNNVRDFDYIKIVTHLATTYCLKHDFETSYDVKMQLVTDLDIELGVGTAEQSLEDLLLLGFDDKRSDDEDFIMQDCNNFPVDFDETVMMVSNVILYWGE